MTAAKSLSRVLIVDDNPGDVLLLEVMLREGFGSHLLTETAGTLAEAQALVATPAERLILLDLSLPDSWGSETFRSIRRVDATSPIVVLTGLQDEELALALVREGAQDYLTKGRFDHVLLARVIQYAWERHCIEDELLERKVWWESIIQAIPDAVLVSERHRVVFANGAAHRLWNRGPGALVGVSLDELFGKVGDGQVLNHELETVVHNAAGEEVPVEISRSEFSVARTNLLATVVRDVSERRRLQQQLVQTQKMEAVGHLSSGIAHDFNNLLAVIVANLDLLRKLAPDLPDVQRRIDVVLRASQRGADLTRRLLSFSRKRDLKPQVLLIQDLLGSFLEMLRRTLGPEIHIESSVDRRLPPVYADGSELENVLLNLALNARDAMPSGGTLEFGGLLVHLGAREPLVETGALGPGDYVELRVSDTGVGMAPPVLERALEPFFTTKEKGKGTGLGLSMVYGFTRQSGGTTWIDSVVGEGTSVKIFLPVHDGQVRPDATTEKAVFRAPPGTRVLLVDDEPDLLEVSSQLLTGLGFEVVSAWDGPSAMALFETQGKFHLLFTDVLMPGGMNGAQLAQALVAVDPGLKVLFTSGFSSQALSDKNVGLDVEIVPKPFLEEDLVRVLHKLFGTGPDPR